MWRSLTRKRAINAHSPDSLAFAKELEAYVATINIDEQTATNEIRVNRYFFNFRQGDAVSRDEMGMFLPDLDAAREEALNTCHDLAFVAQEAGEVSDDGEIEIADASGEAVLRIPIIEQCLKH